MAEMMAWVKYSLSVGFNFNGRARRREFWWNFLFWELISIALSIVFTLLGIFLGLIVGADGMAAVQTITSGLSTIASLLISIVIMLPLYIRRLHDIGMSGWIYLACIVGTLCCCVGSIILIVLMCQDSNPGDNAYGSNPKAFGGNMPNGYGGPDVY